ncbi:MAG: peptide deformylase [Bacteroidales bacterium]|nr:peptide deformylase [Bacteroidales bacterium]
MKRLDLFVAIAAMMLAAGCAGGWSSAERKLIEDQPAVMRVLTVEDEADLKVLRTPCHDFSARELADPLYATLAAKMVATVTSPEQNGVGIAGPQVGLSRNVVAVQRLDKEGEPFEVYPNIRITAFRGDPEPGSEGCLSVPGRRGKVLRWRDIDIRYTSAETGRQVTERIQGFTAVIFQHETDHLQGILYTDKLVQENQE